MAGEVYTPNATRSKAAQINTYGAGIANANGVTAAEYGDGYHHHTVLTLALSGANIINMADGADKTVGTKLYDFAGGLVRITSAVANLVSTSSGIDAAYEAALGSADGTNAASADISGTEEDIIAGFSITNGDNQDGHAFQTGAVSLDGTSTAADIYLNIAQTDLHTTAAATFAITGTIEIEWTYCGDY